MAEMTELDALKVALADKQMSLDAAVRFEQTTLAVLRGLKDGTLSLERIVMTDTGYQLLSVAEVQAGDVARQAEAAGDA